MHDLHEPRALLNGWKEIAAYLGKSVRSVQRWETTLGLPVHRIRTPDGQIVYSERSEIDEWRRRLDGPPASEPEDPDDPESLPEPPLVPGTAPEVVRRRWGPVWLMAAGIALFLGGLLSGWSLSRPSPVAVSVALNGRSLQGLSQAGVPVWSYRFDRDVTRAVTRALPLVDLDGDGVGEWLIPIQFSMAGDHAAASHALYCFTEAGALKWALQPDQTLSYPNRTVTAPWLITDFAVTPEPPRRVWASFVSRGNGYGFVVEISAGGTPTLRYVQVGPIFSVFHWITPSGGFLVAGGYSSKHRQPSVALMPENDPPASFPFDDPGIPTCAECPQKPPRRVLLFAPSELGTGGANTFVRQLVPSGQALQVVTHAGGTEHAHINVNPDFSVASFNYTSRHWHAHKEQELQGRLDHSEENCPDRRVSNIFREWTPADGWKQREIRPVTHP